MKFLLIGAAALALTVVSPVAAKDLTPAKPAGPVDQWSGFYVGAHVGYGKADRNGCGDLGANIDAFGYVISLIQDPVAITSCDIPNQQYPGLTYDYTQQGYLLGLQGGYNWLPAENFLIGLEGSFSVTNMTGDLTNGGDSMASPFGGTGTWNSLAMATAKAGVAAGNFLIYGEGGYALSTSSFTGNIGCDFTMTHTGPVAGAGVSFKVSDQASIDIKYDHVWANAAQATCNSVLLDAVDHNLIVNVPTSLLTQGSADIVKVGVNFKLGGP